MSLLASLRAITPTRWPNDRPSTRFRTEAERIRDNFETLGVIANGIVGDASIVVGAEAGDARAITIQLKKANGDDVDSVQMILAAVFLNAAATAFVVTGGSTGIAIGTDGTLLALVAKKVFLLTCEADGDIDLTWTDTGTEAAYLGLWLPNGKLVMSAALTNA
jgi:hypothetical protein